MGTEIGQPVSIIDGGCNVCSPKENGDVAGKALNILETEINMTAENPDSSDSSSCGTSGAEREPASSGSNPRVVSSLSSICESGGGLQTIGLLTTFLEKVYIPNLIDNL